MKKPDDIPNRSSSFTELLESIKFGDEAAREELTTMVYQELKGVARRHLGRMRINHSGTLATTALVNETYIKLFNGAKPSWESRGHFFSIAAKAMRQVILDDAKYRAAKKRSAMTVDLSPEMLIDEASLRAERLLEIEAALSELNRSDPRAASVFDCRFFAGYSTKVTADSLQLTIRTTERLWKQARDFIRERLC